MCWPEILLQKNNLCTRVITFMVSLSFSVLPAPELWEWKKILWEIKDRAVSYSQAEASEDVPKAEDMKWMHGNAGWVARTAGKDLLETGKVSLAASIEALYFKYYNFQRFFSKYAVSRNKKDFDRAHPFFKAIMGDSSENSETFFLELLQKKGQVIWTRVASEAVRLTCEQLDLIVKQALRDPCINFVRELRQIVDTFQAIVADFYRKLIIGDLPELKQALAAQESLALDSVWAVVLEIKAYGKKVRLTTFEIIRDALYSLSTSTDDKMYLGWVRCMLFEYLLPAEWLLQLAGQNAVGIGFRMMAYGLFGELAECSAAVHILRGSWLDKFRSSKTSSVQAARDRREFVVECLFCLSEQDRGVTTEFGIASKKLLAAASLRDTGMEKGA